GQGENEGVHRARSNSSDVPNPEPFPKGWASLGAVHLSFFFPMPTVNTSVWIDATPEQVYAIARDNRSFPEFMEDVASITMLSEEGDAIVSEWVGKTPAFGLKVRWTQEDIWEPEAKTCRFKQVKGDYESMEGVWTLKAENNGTRF